VSDQGKNINGLSFAKESDLDQAERQLISSNKYECNYRWQHMLNEQYMTMSVSGVSTIIGLVSMVIDK